MTLTITQRLNGPAEVIGDPTVLPDISTKPRLWRRFTPRVSLRLPDRSTVQFGQVFDDRATPRWARRNLTRCMWTQPHPLPVALRGKIRRRNHR